MQEGRPLQKSGNQKKNPNAHLTQPFREEKMRGPRKKTSENVAPKGKDASIERLGAAKRFTGNMTNRTCPQKRKRREKLLGVSTTTPKPPTGKRAITTKNRSFEKRLLRRNLKRKKDVFRRPKEKTKG